MPVSTVEVLISLLEEQEDAIQSIAIHLSVGQDLSPLQLEAIFQLKRRFEETRRYLEAMIEDLRTSDSIARTG